MFQATIFDYNGVLVDDERLHLAAFQDALAPLGVHVSEADYWEKYLGFDDAGAFEAILLDAGKPAPADAVTALIVAKKPLYLARARAELVGFPGGAVLLKECAAAGPVIIVSGALRDEIELGLEVLGVRDNVLAIVSAEDAPRSKPDPQGYLKGMDILRAHGVADPTKAAFVIEDSVSGVEAAKAAGLLCVGVCHSYPEAALIQAGADCVVEKIAQLSAAVLRDLYESSRA